MEENIYRKSLFTHVIEDGNNLIFYNSMEGIKSIKKVSSRYQEKITRYLSSEKIHYSKDPILDTLIENNYVICDEVNEYRLLDSAYVNCCKGNVLHLIILPTEQCNFRCKYCYESFSRGKMRDEIINAIIKYVRINILKYTGLRVSWFGGEPSLEIDTICKMSETFLEICKKTKRAYWANITSNGYLINNDNFERLYKAHVFHFQITIDGIQRTHDSQRILTGGEGSFTQIIKNLIDIKNNKRFTHWNITIRTNFSKTIYDVIDEYIDYYYELFNDDSRFSFLFRPAGDWGGTVVKGYKENMLDNNGLSQVLEKMLNNNKLLNIERHLSFLNPGGSMCIAGMKNTFLIDSKGGIRKCSCHLDDDRNLIGQVSINGNFEIDKRKMNEWSFFELEKKCEECDFLPACINNACPANYVLKRGDTKECHVYEKCCLDYILKILNRQGKVEEILI